MPTSGPSTTRSGRAGRAGWTSPLLPARRRAAGRHGPPRTWATSATSSPRSSAVLPMPGYDVEVELAVTLDDLLRGGKRRIQIGEGKTLDVEIPIGLRDGVVLRLAGQGGPGTSGGPPGDGYLHARMVPHPRYR